MPDAPANAKRPRRFRWRRFLLGALLLLLVLILGAVIGVRAFLEDPEPLLARAARQFGQELRLDNLEFSPAGRLLLRDVSLRESGAERDYVQIDYLELNWNYRHLQRREVDELRVHGIRLWLSRMPKGASGPDRTLIPFTLKRLILGQATLMLEGLGEGIPPIPVKVGEVDPIVLNNLHLGGAVSDPAAARLQSARAFNISIRSPLDPLAPVLFFEEIELQFSWAGIQEKRVDRLTLERPVLYVGEDLFWFVDLVKKNKLPPAPAATPAAKPDTGAAPWTLDRFEIEGGEIEVTTFGRPGLQLPLTFSTRASGLTLDDFNELALDIECAIPRTDLDYPEYNLRVTGMRGDLQFSLPPGEKANNVVQTIYFDTLSWRDIDVKDAYVSMTFDRRGLFAKFQGARGGGYVGGDLSVFADRGFEWTASAWATDIEAAPVSQRLSPAHVTLEGVIDGTFIVSGKQKVIERFHGDVVLDTPGVLTVTAVDDLLERLPDHWNSLKKELTTVSLEAFQRYDYTRGRCEFNYAPPKSFLQLRMDGEQGKRNFDLRWLDLRENPTLAW